MTGSVVSAKLLLGPWQYPDGSWKKQYSDGSWEKAEVSYVFRDMVMMDVTGNYGHPKRAEGGMYSHSSRYCAEDHNRPYHFRERIVCRDGLSLSVSTVLHAYSCPRPDAPPRDDFEAHYRKRQSTYSSVELMTWSPTPLDPVLGEWAELAHSGACNDDRITYSYVPVGVVALAIVSHGGTESKDLPGGVSDAVEFWENHPEAAAATYDAAQTKPIPEESIALERFDDSEWGPPNTCGADSCEYCTNYQQFKDKQAKEVSDD